MALVGSNIDCSLELSDILDLDKLALVVWWWICADAVEHILIEL